VKRLALAFAAAWLLSGCGLILNGGPSVVDLQVAPEGADLTIKGVEADDVRHEKGPRVKLTLDRSSSYAILATADGYKPRLARVRASVTPGYWLDLAPMALVLLSSSSAASPQLNLLGTGMSLLGMTVDVFAHTAYQHDVHAVDLILEKQK
jgi:hypothetical protein